MTTRQAYARLPPRALCCLHLWAVVRRARIYHAEGLPLPLALVVADRILRGESRGRA